MDSPEIHEKVRTWLSSTRMIHGKEFAVIPAPANAFRCVVHAGGTIVTIDVAEDRVILANYIVPLRRKELDVLQALLQRAGQVVSKEDLLRVVWGYRAIPTTSIVETCMSRLRTRLGSAASIIETVRDGYRISLARHEET